MNKQLIKKVGELVAFSAEGKDTYQKGKQALQQVLNGSEVDELIDFNYKQHEDLKKWLQENDGREGLEKAEKTQEKLLQMRDVYLENKWEEAAEVMEWLGFSEGAAIVHYSLVEEMSAANEDLNEIARSGHAFHKEVLQKLAKAIQDAEE